MQAGCARAESGGKKVSRSTISGGDSISWTHSLKKQLEISLHISVHLCVCVCLCVPVCSVYVCVCVQKCQWAIRQLVVCAGGHLRASQRTPPHTPCQSHTVFCHDVPTGEANHPSILSLCRTFFVSLYTLHNVHLSPPLLLSCYHIVDNVIPVLSGCPLDDPFLFISIFPTLFFTLCLWW